MNRTDTESLASLELIVLGMLIADPSLQESLGLVADDLSDATLRRIVNDMVHGNGSAPKSLTRWLERFEVDCSGGVRAGLVERLRRFRNMERLETADPLAARVARYMELCDVKKKRQEQPEQDG